LVGGIPKLCQAMPCYALHRGQSQACIASCGTWISASWLRDASCALSAFAFASASLALPFWRAASRPRLITVLRSAKEGFCCSGDMVGQHLRKWIVGWVAWLGRDAGAGPRPSSLASDSSRTTRTADNARTRARTTTRTRTRCQQPIKRTGWLLSSPLLPSSPPPLRALPLPLPTTRRPA
jgi:hypothetical protein